LAFGSKADFRAMAALPQQQTLAMSNWMSAVSH
jgi:hypothetical protein